MTRDVRRRRRRTLTVALWCLPFLPVAFRQFVFITALVYRPDRLAEMADLMRPIVVLNFAYVVAGVGDIPVGVGDLVLEPGRVVPVGGGHPRRVGGANVLVELIQRIEDARMGSR